VQFSHRIYASLVLLTVGHLAWVKKSGILMFALFMQVALGVSTLLLQVPFWLALVHQLNAFYVLSLSAFLLFSKRQ
jgi:cytochrome c oxidase assembly protein subunit 15